MKICTKCKTPTENIHPKSSWCRACCAELMRNKLKDPEYKAKRKARRREIWLAKPAEERLEINRKKSAKARQKYGRKAVMQRAHQKNRYGMTLEEREWLYGLKLGCWLCSKPFIAPVPVWDRCVDHDHEDHIRHAGEVHKKRMCKQCIRGVLCYECNIKLLPLLEKNPHLQNDFVKQYLLGRPFLERIDESVIDLSRNLGVV